MVEIYISDRMRFFLSELNITTISNPFIQTNFITCFFLKDLGYSDEITFSCAFMHSLFQGGHVEQIKGLLKVFLHYLTVFSV